MYDQSVVPEPSFASDPLYDLAPVVTSRQPLLDLEAAKLYLKVDHDEEDDLINRLIVAAQRYCENATNRALSQQTWEMRIDSENNQINPRIELPRPPFRELISATVTDREDRDTELDVTTLRVRGQEPAVVTLPGNRSINGAYLTLRFRAGYDSLEQAPPEIEQATRLLLAHWYENREASTPANRDLREPPHGVNELLSGARYTRL